MVKKPTVRIAVCILCLQFFLSAAPAQKPSQTEKVLISIPKPYDRVVSGIQALGGKVHHQYTYIDGIAAEIPFSAMAAVRNLVGPNAMTKDKTLPHPIAAAMDLGRPVWGKQMENVGHSGFNTIQPMPEDAVASFAASHAGAYVLNTDGIDIQNLHAQGYTGKDVIVAVLDSGIRPGFASLDSGNSIIGGIDFVDDGMGFSNPDNEGHGTFVASMISARAEVDLTGNPALLNAIANYAPSALFHGSSVALIGSAPASKIYVVRIFGTESEVGTLESTIIDAIQHVIDKRKAYEQGNPDGLDIQVCNLSFGNTTLAAGVDLLDRSVDALLDAGIIPVVSAGNAGPAILTTASPASSYSALTVGSANFARNERIANDISFGEGIGALERPTMDTQIAYFSSRGPNADGRPEPHVVASGFANIGQGYFSTSDVSIASGTSFSAPIVSGVAAVLRQAFPDASATDIRNAIIASANDSLIKNASALDEGNGLVNAKDAFDLLEHGDPRDKKANKDPSHDVQKNVESGTDLKVQNGTVKMSLEKLQPAERRDILYNVQDATDQVVITLSNVNPSLPPDQQNALFGDDILLFVHSAKTSAIGEVGDYLAGGFTLGGTFTIPDPEPGLLRVSISGDWTNAGTISADVTITSSKNPVPMTLDGKIADAQFIVVPIDIPGNVKLAEFRLSWDENWGRYPTNDVDLYLIDPDNNVIADAATLRDPELATVMNPIPGAWYLLIDGFDLPAGTDRYRLTVLLDHKVVKSQ
jgi:serine protease AprX